MVTDKIIKELQNGQIPWQKPWSGNGILDGGAINYISRKPYSLLNQMLLGEEGEYLTFKQVKSLGGNIKKGAKSRIVVFFTMTEIKKNEDKETEKELRIIPILKYYRVFHLNDCTGIKSKIVEETSKEPEVKPIDGAESVICEYLSREKKLKFENDRPTDRAFYSPSEDKVVVPMLAQYKQAEEYYSTAFHEFVHSTMKPYRCDRKEAQKIAGFGSNDYSREELVAEIGSAMLCNSVGLDSKKAFRNSVAYIQSWLKVLENDNRIIVWASSRAEKAVKYITNINE